jgi:Uma2 family endonuclease
MAHQDVVTNLGTPLSVFVREGDLGKLYFAPTDVILSDSEVVQPDLLFISKEREHIRTSANIQGAPDFIVEILSPSSAQRDWGRKRDLYARHQVKEYWIVDPANRIVYVMLLRDRVLDLDATYGKGDTVNSATLEGFSVDVGDLFS